MRDYGPLGALEGVCALCGQQLIITPDDCWHPYDVERACPPEPAPDDWGEDGWPAFYAAGHRPGRPGREHWREADQ